jgi:hypothetical protein
MVRPEEQHPGYFVLVDEIHTIDAGTRVQWLLHGRGKMTLSVDQVARWRSRALGSSQEVHVSAFSLAPASARSQSGSLFSRSPWLTQPAESLILEWTGSKRLPTLLFPRTAGMSEPSITAMGEAAGRIGDTDWISLGQPGSRRTTGPLSHISEYVIARDRNANPPAVLMVSGTEFRMGPHLLKSDKPVTVSLNGLSGGLLTTRPATRVEIHSPAIHGSDTFILDHGLVIRAQEGRLTILLDPPGEHGVRPRQTSYPEALIEKKGSKKGLTLDF